LIHRLLERLPDFAATKREAAAHDWLDRQAGDFDPALRSEMVDKAIGVLSDPEYAAIFSPSALAEVPLAAKIGGIVVAGTADRLLVEEKCVTVVDFKTTRRPPQTLDDVPGAVLRQMAAYVAAIEAIYPGREVRAALLYTHAPRLIAIPSATLASHKQGLAEGEESYRSDRPMRIE